MKTELTAEYAREALDYNPETGDLVWKRRPLHHFKHLAAQRTWSLRFINTLAGTKETRGYLQIRLAGIKYCAHRLAWLIYSGSHPREQLDHKNGIKTDNRICNLREATCSQNRQNIFLQKNNTSGFKGVSYNHQKNKWLARLKKEGKTFNLGYYDAKEEANQVICARREKEHLEFANHGDFC